MEVRFVKCHPDAKTPSKVHTWDAGYDLTAVSMGHANTKYVEYKTGLIIEIPIGYAGFLFPRSSISNYGLSLANSVGVVDSNFTGEVVLRFKRIIGDDHNLYGVDAYKIGDRVGQIIILPVPQIDFKEVDCLPKTKRNGGGFGSTGE